MKTLQKFTPLITILLIIIVWYIGAIIVNMPLILPTPHETFLKMLEIFTTSKFYSDLFGTVGRILTSFLISFLAAVILALISCFSSFFERLCYPLVVIVRAVPTMSVIFLCLIWFNSKISPIIVAITLIFPTLYSSLLTAIKSTDSQLVEMSKVYKVPLKTRIFKLYLPSVSEKAFSDSVSALSFNVKLVIAAEALAQTSTSLGVDMQISKLNLETAQLFAYTVAAVILSFLLELLLKFIRFIFREVKHATTK